MPTTTHAPNAAQLRRTAAVMKALGHPLRLRILGALEEGERTVSQLQTITRSTQASVSRQLAMLRGRRIVSSRRQGVHVFYRIVDPTVRIILDCIRREAPSA